jgi:glycosyltransferase involved in cell wall biosynthesis
MSMDAHSVSGIIAVRNGANYLAEAIKSCLAQTLKLSEILVVDDGSTDNTAEIARGFGAPVRVIQQEWRGVAAALNNGIAHASTEFIAFLDHDDLWLPEKTALQYARMREKPELETVFVHTEQFISPELVEVLRGKIRVPGGSQAGIMVSGMFIRKAAFDRLGLFDRADKNAVAFGPWYARALGYSLRSETLSETLVRRRIHNSNYTRSEKQDYHEQMLSFIHNVTLQKRQRKDDAI